MRNKQLDSKRQKLKADLEARERSARGGKTQQNYAADTRSAEEILKEQIDRLRHEGSKLLEEEQELMRQQIHSEKVKLDNRKFCASILDQFTTNPFFFSLFRL